MTTGKLRGAVLMIAGLALALTLWRAPFEYVGRDEIARLQNGQSIASAPTLRGLHYAPAWTTPGEDDIAEQPPGFEAQSIELSAARLALVWGVVVIVAGLLLSLAPRLAPQASDSPRRPLVRLRR